MSNAGGKNMLEFFDSAIVDECVPVLLQPLHRRCSCPMCIPKVNGAQNFSVFSDISQDFGIKHLEDWVKAALYLYCKLSPLKISVVFF